MLASGQYPRASLVYRLHPLFKIAVAGSLTVASLILGNSLALGLILVFFLGILVIGRVRPSRQVALGLILLLMVVALGNLWASANPAEAAKYSLRFAIFVVGVPVCAATTAPQELARSLARWRLPAPIVISLLLVWRFFPVMREEVREIRQANLLRGASQSRTWQEWYRGILLPFSFILFEYADRVALALDLRAFDPARPRTWYRLPAIGRMDWGFLSSAVLVLLLAIFLEIFGFMA
jgi:energy-coupling factor transport system permease protein